MRASSYKVIEYTLTLTEHEAERLMAMVQNKISDCESEEDSRLREDIFTSLSEQGCHL